MNRMYPIILIGIVERNTYHQENPFLEFGIFLVEASSVSSIKLLSFASLFRCCIGSLLELYTSLFCKVGAGVLFVKL